MTTTITDTPRVWIGSLGDYNAGRLIGEWVDADDADTIYEGIRRVLAQSLEPIAEEWFFADSDNFYGLVNEYETVERVAEMADHITRHGEAWARWAKYHGLEHALENDFDEAYRGHWDSEKEYAQEFAESTGAMPTDNSWPQSYIDWEAAARDLFIDLISVPASGSGIYVYQA